MDLHNQEIEIELWYEHGEPVLISVRTGYLAGDFQKQEHFGKVVSHNQGDFEDGIKFSLLKAVVKRIAY